MATIQLKSESDRGGDIVGINCFPIKYQMFGTKKMDGYGNSKMAKIRNCDKCKKWQFKVEANENEEGCQIGTFATIFLRLIKNCDEL